MDEGGLASVRVLSTVEGDHADLFAFGDLVEQLRQYGAANIASWRKLHQQSVGLGRIHVQLHLRPLALALNVICTGMPFNVAGELNAGVIEQQVQGPMASHYRILTARVV